MQKAIVQAGGSRIFLMPAGENAYAIKGLAGWYKKLGFRKVQRFNGGGWLLEWIAKVD